MNEIAQVKKEVKLEQWAEMVRSRNESGLTVTDWCKQNGINLKTKLQAETNASGGM